MRFMTTSLSKLDHNFKEGIHKIRCRLSLVFWMWQDDLIKYNCLSCNKDYLNKLNGELKKKKIKNTLKKSSNNDINKFILLLTKCVYPNEYMHDWGKFNETKLPEKRRIL